MSIARLMQMAAAEAGGGNPWDVTTAVYNGSPQNWFRVAGDDPSPQGFFFKSDGTKMYVAGNSNDSVLEYDLSTPWDISKLSYLQSFSVSSQSTNPTGVFFKPDGTKMYVSCNANDSAYEYDLSTAWDVSTASYLQSFSLLAQDASIQDLFFKPDGAKMYIVGGVNDSVYEYDLSTSWNISTASYQRSFSVASQDTSPTGVFFKPDGTKMYVAGNSSDSVLEYDLSTAWNVSSASYLQNFSITNQETSPEGLFFKDDGSKIYTVGGSKDSVYEYDLSTAWDVSSGSWVAPTTDYYDISAQSISPSGVSFKPDGTKMYVVGSFSDAVHEYNLSTDWEVSSASYVQSFSVAGQDTIPGGLFFKDDGTKMYVVGDAGNDINEYDLSTAWDISTASYLQNFSLATEQTTPTGVSFRTNGRRMYVSGRTPDAVHQYTIGTAWNISTASYSSKVLTLGTSNPTDLYFRDDGLKLYVTGSSFDIVYSYDLSTAWDVSTATNSGNFNNLETFTGVPAGIFFKPDGTKMYIACSDIDAIISFDL